jgi:prepilin-type N-terminal cleavage/methylation domain-containing protein
VRTRRQRTGFHRPLHAFTLIELLVVVAIIALLLAILTPSLNTARELALHAVCASQLRQIGTATQAYALGAGGALPRGVPHGNLDQLGIHKPFEAAVAYWHDKAVATKHLFPDGSPMPWSLGLLWHQKVIGDPRVFYCPKQSREAAGVRSYQYYEDLGWAGPARAYGSYIDRSVFNYILTGYLYIPYAAETGPYDRRDDRPAALTQARLDMVLAVDDILGALTDAPSPHPEYQWNVARFDGAVARVAADRTWVDDISWPRYQDPWLTQDWRSFNELLRRLEHGSK